ncbi:hypothetical protein [Nostoc sp.]|uniref:hypothetical protein n=1 Tax=Nostoc sp. TaxID=1180 RepID=UPI002FF6FBC0
MRNVGCRFVSKRSHSILRGKPKRSLPHRRSPQPGVFGRVGGVGAEVFGDFGEAESRLSYCFGRKSVECFGVGNQRLIQF